jgi:hypothetical protein
MLSDAYRAINKSYTPSNYDVESYSKVLDRNGDGKITLSDIEALVIKYMCGE